MTGDSSLLSRRHLLLALAGAPALMRALTRLVAAEHDSRELNFLVHDEFDAEVDNVVALLKVF
jgi:hypothetical protein